MKYLMRGGMSPLDEFSVEQILADDSFGGNSGNLLYLFSVFKTLMTENVEIDMDYYKTENQEYSDEELEYINSEYDAYICPLADAFRPDFRKKLLRFESFFRKLKIPVVIIGIGLRAPYEPDLTEENSFDIEAKKFMSAVLEKTECVGVRGHITAEYLEKLGYKVERDFKVIGCPSMYTWGNNLPDINLRSNKVEELKLAVNLAPVLSIESVQTLQEIIKSVSDYYYIGQELRELRALYLGHPYENYVDNEMDSIMRLAMECNRFRFFVGVNEWFDFMKTCDLSIGGRLHGNVAALLAGRPALFLPADARMRELVEFHNFSQETKENLRLKKLEQILAETNFSSHLAVQGKNFQNYIDFLNRNNIKHIYQKESKGEIKFQEKIKNKTTEVVDAISSCDRDEIVKREMDYYTIKLKNQEKKANYQKKWK